MKFKLSMVINFSLIFVALGSIAQANVGSSFEITKEHSLLDTPDEDGFSLESMVASGRVRRESEHSGMTSVGPNKIKKNVVANEKILINKRNEVNDLKYKKLNNQLLKTKLELSKRTKELNKTHAELAAMRESISGRDNNHPFLSYEKKLQMLTHALQDKNDALTAALKRENENKVTLKTILEKLSKETKASEHLRRNLAERNDELKKVNVTLAQMSHKNIDSFPIKQEQKLSYVAGLVMAEGLNHRLEGWALVGVKTDLDSFSKGLHDGLRHKLQLNASEAQRIQSTFIKDVQAGVARKVAEAQKILRTQAKGRNALKSGNGITWYRVRAGRPVKHNQPVRLSMTEQVVGEKMISKVPALTLHPNDELPIIIKDGMYLPGEQGEVVAYALAENIYKGLPLPSGVQPWSVMEYHLKGEPLTSRSG
ncbi:FKBP-type peptidyl-prolyl cis-trans isomerase N-terminal domain-containing protein [Salmonella enterica]